MSLFDFVAENNKSLEANDGEQHFSFPLPQQIIDESLCLGSNEIQSRLTICAYFMKDKPLTDNAYFLKNIMEKTVRDFISMTVKYQFGITRTGFVLLTEVLPVKRVRLLLGNKRQSESGNYWTWDGICRRANWSRLRILNEKI